MGAGDAHRVWFPEMVEHLRLRWRDDLSMAVLLGLRDELDDILGRIRSTRHIPRPGPRPLSGRLRRRIRSAQCRG